MPYGITQCYLPPDRCDISTFDQAEAGKLVCVCVIIMFNKLILYLFVLLNGRILNLASARRILAAFCPPGRPDGGAVSSLWFDVRPGAPGPITGNVS